MKFKGTTLSPDQINTIKDTETYQLFCYCPSLQQAEDGSLILPKDNIIIIDNTITFAKGCVSILYFDDDYNSIIFRDPYGYSLFMIEMKDKIVTITEKENSIFLIQISNDHKEYVDPIYPIFTTELEYIKDTTYIGKLYAEFSPITNKEKYLITTATGTINYINSKFNIIMEDSNNSPSNIFNTLGILRHPTTLFRINNITGKYVGKYNINSIDDQYINLTAEDESTLQIEYLNIINPSKYDFSYILAENDYLVYNANDDSFSHEVNLIQLNVLRGLEPSDLNQYYYSYEAMKDFVTDKKDSYSQVEKKEWKHRLENYSEIFNKFNQFKLFKGIIYIDINNKFHKIDNIIQYGLYINTINSIIK